MKAFVLFSLFFFVNLSTAESFTFVERNTEVMLKNTTDTYNKNSFNFSKADVDQKFLKDFNSYLKNTKNKKPWKAEVHGNTVYFKKDRGMFKINIVEVKNTTSFVLSINGKNFAFNSRDGFKKNHKLMKDIMMVRKASLWELILPSANAVELEAPDEMEDQLSSALSWTTWAWSWMNSESNLQKERICNLNQEEKRSKYIPSGNRDTLLSEIRFLVQIQNKFVKEDMRDQKSGHECISTKCHEAKEFQGCIVEVANRRKEAITATGSYGFACYEKYDKDYDFRFLNSDLLTTSFVESKYSLEEQMEDIETDRRSCQHEMYDSAKANCKKQIEKRVASLLATCPQDEKTFKAIQSEAVQRSRATR